MSSLCHKSDMDTRMCCVDSAPSKGMTSAFASAAAAPAAPWDIVHRRHRPECSGGLCVLAVSCAVVFFVAGAAMAAFTVSYVHQMERRMEERIDRAIRMCSAHGAKDGLLNTETHKTQHSADPLTFDIQPLRFKRSQGRNKKRNPNSGDRGGKCKKEKAKPRCPTAPPNFFHLRGRNNSLQYENGLTFIWDNASVDATESMELVKEPLTGGIIKVRVKTRGSFLVYSQVAVTGQDRARSSIRHECSHETIVEDKTGKTRTLLSSRVTQHKLGENDPNTLFIRGLNPIDTKLQMGVFVLDKGDVLSVRIQDKCGHFNYSVAPDDSYFGVVAMNV